jgi:hypothetical protein
LNKAEAFPAKLPPETQVPANVVLLHNALQQVQQLDHNPHPHSRDRWLAGDGNGCRETKVNP